MYVSIYTQTCTQSTVISVNFTLYIKEDYCTLNPEKLTLFEFWEKCIFNSVHEVSQ